MEGDNLSDHLSNDTVLQLVHSRFIKLQMEEVKETKILLDQIVIDLVERMKKQDPLFGRLYSKIVFCGSFYKGTKISKPNEFDLNIILNLTKCTVDRKNIHFSFSQPAFVKIAITKSCDTPGTKYNNMSEKEKRILNRFIQHGYLHPHLFRNWIEQVLTRSLTGKLPLVYNSTIELIGTRKSGPAFTLILKYRHHDEKIHIDIVPALNFHTDIIVNSPVNFKKIEQYTSLEWFAVPVPKNTINGSDDNLHWRQSFFYQEREILRKYGRIKNIIRLMKKLRDTQNWYNIASYFIEILSFNRLESIKEELDAIPLTGLFYFMLTQMYDDFHHHTTKYFWDERYNLLSKISEDEMINIKQRLGRIIRDIRQKASTDPLVIAKWICKFTSLRIFKQYTVVLALQSLGSGTKFLRYRVTFIIQ